MNKIEVKKKEYEKINENKLNNEIDQLRVENEKIYEDQKLILPDIGRLKHDKDRFKGILKELDKTGKTEVLCWICEGKKIERSKIEEDLKKTINVLNPKEKEISDLEIQINNNKREIVNKQNEKKKKKEVSLIKEKIETIRNKLIKLAEENQGLIAQKGNENKDIEKYTRIIESRAKNIEDLEKKRNELEVQIVDDTEINKTREFIKNLTTKKGSVENEISNLGANIEQCKTIEILKFQIDISEVKEIIKDLDEIFNDINNHLEMNIKEQREGAAIKFNDNIQKIITELKLPKFEKVYLDIKENNNLKIIRKGNPNPQAINSLSGGERVVVSSLLQISAKETYNPEIPFILGDDIILKMDDERREIFHNYLKNIAKKNNWFIILTRVTNEDLIKEEI